MSEVAVEIETAEGPSEPAEGTATESEAEDPAGGDPHGDLSDSAAAEAPQTTQPAGDDSPESSQEPTDDLGVVEPAPTDTTIVEPPPRPPEVFAGDFEVGDNGDHFEILGRTLEPGELRQFNWQLETAMAGLAVPTPVLVALGGRPGPALCLVAAVHGDELNGVEIVRRIMFDLDLEKLSGSVIGIPIANSFGFLRGSRYLPDRRDLNRFFPGDTRGSMASRFAYALFNELIRRCDVLVDIHTGSFHRTNLPQLRADLTIPSVLELSRQFGNIAVLHSLGPSGSLRRAATDAGIPAVTMEAGGPARFQEGAIEAGVEAIEALLNQMGMIERFRLFGQPQPVFYDSTWVRAETGGILLANVRLGDEVKKGQRLGTVTDPIENRREILKAPFRGRVLGMAVNQVVMPGFAAFHIGRAANERQAIESTGSGPMPVEPSDDAVTRADDEDPDAAPGPVDEPEPELPPAGDSDRTDASPLIEPVEVRATPIEEIPLPDPTPQPPASDEDG